MDFSSQFTTETTTNAFLQPPPLLVTHEAIVRTMCPLEKLFFAAKSTQNPSHLPPPSPHFVQEHPQIHHYLPHFIVTLRNTPRYIKIYHQLSTQRRLGGRETVCPPSLQFTNKTSRSRSWRTTTPTSPPLCCSDFWSSFCPSSSSSPPHLPQQHDQSPQCLYSTPTRVRCNAS